MEAGGFIAEPLSMSAGTITGRRAPGFPRSPNPRLKDPQYLNKHKWGSANRKSTARILKYDDVLNYSPEWMDALKKAITRRPLAVHHLEISWSALLEM